MLPFLIPPRHPQSHSPKPCQHKGLGWIVVGEPSASQRIYLEILILVSCMYTYSWSCSFSLWSSCWPGLWLSQDSTGTGESASKLIYLVNGRPQFLLSRWLEVSITYHVGLSKWLLTIWHLVLREWVLQEGERKKAPKTEVAVFYITWPWKWYIITSALCYQPHTWTLVQRGKGPDEGMNTTRWGLLGAILEADPWTPFLILHLTPVTTFLYSL